MDQSTQAEVLEVDERFKKLQRTLKLALLKNMHNKNVDNKLSSGTTWSNISSIHGDASSASCLNSPLNPPMSHAPSMNSEILTSSNNLRNILLKKKHDNIHNKKIMATSSVKQCDINQDKFDQFVMPPPVGNKVYHTDGKKQDRIHVLSNNEKAASNSVSNIQGVNRVFSRWKVMFNNQYELIIKGTLDCGKIVHSKPIVRRYTATCIESKFRHKYYLRGNIVDETNELPDYVRNKFYNGFPDDWENVYLIWKTYINKGCPIMFRWPAPIADSDDDLNSEMTDLTYTCVNNDRTVSKTKSYKSAEHIESEYLNNEFPSEKKKYNCSANNSQSFEKNTSFVKPFIPNSEDNTASIAQTRNANLAYNKDNEPNFKSNVNTSYSPRKMTKLINPGGYIQEDKLNIIVNNLMDKNCPQTYIDKIINMFDCLNYVASYRPLSECSYDSIDLVNQNTSKSELISQQQIIMHDNNRTDTSNIENRMTDLKSYTHSTDPGYESIKNDFIAHQSKPVSIEAKHNIDNIDSDKLESEIYAGIPKIPIEQVLRHRGRIYKRPARKKIIPQQYSHCTVNSPYAESIQSTISTMNARETLFSKPCTMKQSALNEATNVKERKIVVHQRPHEATFSINSDVPRNNTGGIRESAKLPQQQARSQVVSNVDYDIDSDIEEITIVTNSQEANANPDIHLDKDIVINNKSNNNVPEKTHIHRRPRGEFIRQSENEIAMKGSKPIVTSSIPVKLNLKISNANLKYAQSHDSDVIIQENKQHTIRSTNEIHTKEPQLSTKSVIANDSHTKITADNKKETHLNKKNPTKSMINPATEQSNNGKLQNRPKVLTAWTPKVVHYAKSTYKLGLIFQGKLLNEVGHVINRSFMTDIVLKRLSERLIETINHEFYELRGDLNDNKHVISKKLTMQCRNGCPANIEQFCLTWETLQNDNLHDTSMYLFKTSVSSRGRTIVRPLCYWEGERISMKDDNPVYNPGSLEESSLTLLKENSNEKLTSKVQTTRATKKSDNSKKSAVNGKRRIAQRLTYSSTDSEEEKKISPRKRLRNSQPKIHADVESLKSRLRKQTFSLRSRTLHESS